MTRPCWVVQLRDGEHVFGTIGKSYRWRWFARRRARREQDGDLRWRQQLGEWVVVNLEEELSA